MSKCRNKIDMKKKIILGAIETSSRNGNSSDVTESQGGKCMKLSIFDQSELFSLLALQTMTSSFLNFSHVWYKNYLRIL